ncbi:type IV pilin protein [Roseburia faecis]|uniref:type IV pilin protein n=1 Tax=Roseburia faecis TaxID=301302 RepID=UPI003F9BB378
MKKELKNTKKKNNKGFSLVELIVVIAIMAVLMAVLAPAMLRYVEKSRTQKDDSAAAEVRHSIEIALSDENVYDKLNGDDAQVVITGSTGAITYTAKSTGNVDPLKTEVDGTVGNPLKISSKTRKAQTCTFNVTFDSTKKTYTISDVDWK